MGRRADRPHASIKLASHDGLNIDQQVPPEMRCGVRHRALSDLRRSGAVFVRAGEKSAKGESGGCRQRLGGDRGTG